MAKRTSLENCTLQFGFKQVEVLEQEPLGQGSYGAVYKARCDQLICAAKKIFPVLLQQDPPESGREHAHPLRRFESECELLKSSDHPNIIQCLGTYRDPETNTPVLLMELMDESLTHFLESSLGDLPYHIQVNLSYDIAQALAFLHSNGIIHRDLSSNNVLLLTGRAKVADFGMHNLVNTTSFQRTVCPGTQAFMPPEVLEESSVHTEKIDNFSLGVLIVQILTRKYPKPTDRFKVTDIPNPADPTHYLRAQVPEVERRGAHISLIDSAHPLLPIALDCLKDHESDRPTSQEICRVIEPFKSTPTYQQSIVENNNQSKDNKVREKEKEIHAKNREIQSKNKELQTKVEQIDKYEHEITRKTISLQKTSEHLSCSQHLLKTNEDQLARLAHELKKTKAENEEINRQLRELGQQVETYEQRSVQLSLKTEYSISNPFSPCSNMAIVDSKIYFQSYDKIYEYNTNTEVWSEMNNHALPVSKGFTIVSVNNVLTIVGGEGRVRNSNKLYSYLYGKWLEVFPPMSSRWVCPLAEYAKQQKLLIVTKCGEFEILNCDTLNWSRVYLPLHWPNQFTVAGDYIYMHTGKTTLSSNETGIRKQLLAEFVKTPNTKEVLHPPLDGIGNITCFDEHLLVVGGETNENHESFCCSCNLFDSIPVQNIYEYVPSKDEWKIVGKMSKPHSNCLAAPMTNKLIIAEYGSIHIMSTDN